MKQGRPGESEPGGQAARDTLRNLRVKLFADGADLNSILKQSGRPYIRGFTTNPTLMRQAGVQDYEYFARQALDAIPDRPISFEVLADDLTEMDRQARIVASWGANVYVKIPVMNTRRESTDQLMRELSQDGIQVNATAVMTIEQVQRVVKALGGGAPCVISIFAGRIADTGRNPVDVISTALKISQIAPNIEILWASVRELFNVIQADECGCHIVTVTDAILDRLPLLGKCLEDYSLETVAMFTRDAALAGYSI